MCGIFGVLSKNKSLKSKDLFKIHHSLAKHTENRGKDASGITFILNNHIDVIKINDRISKLIETDQYQKLYTDYEKDYQNSLPFFAIGHSRMATNGFDDDHNNNQPVLKEGSILLHNGIIVNEEEIYQKYPFEKSFEVDSEVIINLFNHFIKTNQLKLESIFNTINGAASLAYIDKGSEKLILASNTGSLYFASLLNNQTLLFASEEFMITDAIKNLNIKDVEIFQVNYNKAVIIDIKSLDFEFINWHKEISFSQNQVNEIKNYSKILNTSTRYFSKNANEKLLINKNDSIKKLKRCTKCLLPETFPGIHYDNKGVCNICNNWKSINYKGKDVLNDYLLKNQGQNKKGDVLIPLSGGRDSCFALGYIKDLGIKPVAYTYDWGMITDLARRNISRMTAQLGVEHILISADIRKKRKNIQKNVTAWLNRPSLGTIPLFMAGDKQFFYYANQLKNQFKIDKTVFGMNPLERTDFKVAFTGVKEKHKEDRHYHLSFFNKAGIAAYYTKEFLLNPGYLNDSLVDTFGAFLSYYFIDHNYEIFFEYYPWNENEINETLINKYDWEIDPNTPSTWRIGDATAAFYNYLYYVVAGFTENDTFRSNQIRQGLITREEALRIVEIENNPRYEAILWYLNTINLDFNKVITKINQIKTFY